MKAKPYLIISYFITCIALAALSDAMLDFGRKVLAHSVEAGGLLILISGPFIFKLERRHWLAYVLAFAFWRVVGFDYLYNLFAGLPWDFHGSTSIWDRILSKQPEHGILFGRIVFLLAAISIPFRYLKD